MKSFLCLLHIVYTISFLVLLTKFSSAVPDHDKARRGANMGLYTFPRIGRSDPSLVNNVHDADEAMAFDSIYNYGDASPEDFDEYQKRGNLIPFPRVGRNDAELRKWAHLLAVQQALDKRTGPSASSGLWFGPRLGKRSINAKELAAMTSGLKEVY